METIFSTSTLPLQSPNISPIKAYPLPKRTLNSISKENLEGKGKKMMLDQLQQLRRQELQQQIDERQMRVVRHLREQQDKKLKQIALMESKSNQWLQQAKTKHQNPNRNCLQLIQRDINDTWRDKNEIKTIYFRPKNTHKCIEKRKHTKNRDSMHPFPSIASRKSRSSSFIKPIEINLTEFGIFTARKDMQYFLRHFRSTIQHQFKGGVQLSNVFDMNRLEYYLLREIHSEEK